MNYCFQVLLLTMLLGCGQSNGRESANGPVESDEQPSRKPTAEEMLRAAGAGYESPPGELRECLGRLIFDVARPVQWSTLVSRNSFSLFTSVFSENIYDRYDAINVHGVRIAVIGPVTDSIKEDIRDDTPWGNIERHEGFIRSKLKYIDVLRREKKGGANAKWEIENLESAIRGYEKVIRETQAGYERVPLPFPQSEAYWTSKEGTGGSPSSSIYRANLTRGDYIYVFESTVKLADKTTKASHAQEFIETVGRFRPRAANEIPTELGLCIPYGFFADDGKMISDIKQSMRWEDAPGVLYTIQTGNSTPKNTKLAYVDAMGTAMAAKYAVAGDEETKPVLTHQIGPKLTKIGGLPASQGGFALKITRSGQLPFEVYDVFTGYSGWWGTNVLPFVLIRMRTRTAEQAPELKQNPPAFKHSMDRLDTLLKSTHLRPTTPLMPDFAAIQQQKR
jgi:hypothetical protein